MTRLFLSFTFFQHIVTIPVTSKTFITYLAHSVYLPLLFHFSAARCLVISLCVSAPHSVHFTQNTVPTATHMIILKISFILIFLPRKIYIFHNILLIQNPLQHRSTHCSKHSLASICNHDLDTLRTGQSASSRSHRYICRFLVDSFNPSFLDNLNRFINASSTVKIFRHQKGF